MSSILSISDLSICFGKKKVVDNISFNLEKGSTLALVGESGSGKSVTALSILRLLDTAGVNYPSGKVTFDSVDLLNSPIKTVRDICGNSVSMIFQEPMTALNPLHSVQKQITEVLTLHQGMSKDNARIKCIQLLRQVKISDPESRLVSYPHELSGGQRQRVMIAMALANNPRLLIADEPTTALDVTVQAEILDLLRDLKTELGMSMLLITHDLGIVRKYSDQIAVMQNGHLVESGTTDQIFNNAQHPYTQKLLSSHPKGGPVPTSQKQKQEILRTSNLKVSFALERPLFGKPKRWLHAVDNVNLAVTKGRTLGIIGESGSGKSTFAMAVLRLIDSSGDILFFDENLQHKREKYIRPYRKQIQIVFQDPFASLSPRMTVGQIIAEGLKIHTSGSLCHVNEQVMNVLIEVGLDPDDQHRYPHEFSGGQRQRIAIARAIVLEPKLLFLDEPTSALDRAIQVQIIDLLRDLQQKKKLTYIFISHDLNIVKAISHDIAVMKNGRVVECASASTIIENAKNPYTQKLIKASMLG